MMSYDTNKLALSYPNLTTREKSSEKVSKGEHDLPPWLLLCFKGSPNSITHDCRVGRSFAFNCQT